MKLSICTAFLILNFCQLYASESEIFTSLNDDMTQAAQTATSNNQNIDYQPFILTVWQYDDLVRFGARNIKDALQLIPGIEMIADNMNNRTAIIRGSNPFTYGQTKLVIDGVVVNDQSFETYNAYLDFPIEMIQRIEVVRGSGSFIDGVNGYSGTINVITKPHSASVIAENGSVFGSFGSDAFRQLGGWHIYDTEHGKLSVDAFYQSQDSISPVSVTDVTGYSGYAPLQSRYLGAGLSYRINDFYLKGRINNYRHGSAFGNMNVLPSLDSRQMTPSWNLEVGNRFALSSNFQLNVKAGIMEDKWKSDEYALSKDFSSYLLFTNRQHYANTSLTYTGLGNHVIKTGYSMKHEKIIDSSRISSPIFGELTDLVDYTYSYPLLDTSSANRYQQEIYLADTIDLSDSIALALSATAVDATHMPFHVNTRGALVYQPDRYNIFKAMISHSERLPSWQEMYTINNSVRIGNPDLKPEQVLSYELQYLYKPSMHSTYGLNLFYLENSKQITASTPDHTYRNIAERNIYGLEAEYRGSIGENDLIALSYSYITGENIKGDEQTNFLPYSSSHILKGAFSYLVTPNVQAGIVGQYYSAKRRSPYDPRTGDMSPFSHIDINLGWKDNNGFYIQGLIKNIGDHIYRYPAPPNTYSDDYPVEGRTYTIRCGWKF